MYTNNYYLEKKKSINFKFGYFPILTVYIEVFF